MVKLEDGSEIEVALNKEDDAFAIFQPRQQTFRQSR